MTLFYFKKSLLGLCLLILLGVSFAVPQALQAVEPFPQGVTLGELKVFVIEYIPEDADNPGFIDTDVAGTGDGVDQMISRSIPITLRHSNPSLKAQSTKATLCLQEQVPQPFATSSTAAR